MDIFALFEGRVSDALIASFPELEGNADILARVVVEPPRDPAHGDLSTNAALVVAKPLGKNPREVAAALATHFEKDEDVASVEIAGPGFLNFRLKLEIWHQVLASIARLKGDYGRSKVGQGEKVNVEYVSANPTGPMHVGHTRGAVFGDALASLLSYAGYDVTKEYYINDAGSQVDTLARSAYLRYREALGEAIEIPSGFYPGDYLIPVGKALVEEFGNSLLDQPESAWLAPVKQHVLAAMMELIKDDLRKLNIEHEVFFSEKTLHGAGGEIEKTLAWLRDEGFIYEGRLEPPKGKTPEDWEDREQTLFRASQFGDDVDRPLIKSDGSYTYFAADIAYHRSKVLRGYTTLIDVLGADHSGYASRIAAAVKAVSGGTAKVDVRFCQLVKLLRNGEPVKMSKRSGDLVTLADVVDEVGPDATRFMLLFRRNDAPLDFDFALVKEQTRDNPVFYVQYAHARCWSVFRNAEKDMPELDVSPEALLEADLGLLSSSDEIELMRMIGSWPRQVAAAARAHEPHRLAFYLHELAALLHAFWAKGKENPSLRFVNQDDPTLTVARLALVDGVRQVLVNGLGLLGVSAPKELS
ncbi:arginine--tRNA ligase [Pelagibacterium xiamenense]|uniref:arginine--tRNA ligase n=1 Tax=Pelagibacterium xiamenense TaxID=2901140 RepID=UPI001E5B6F57|nr:arginine--tRNA ligase [Pelagibacterium xiamenense]MCD7061060.1 arginine--tRNA ligase [Pelagibacterium xiamenense]